jgi:DNA-binding transcriptional ArsR family regulator
VAATHNPARQSRTPGPVRPGGLVRPGITAASLPTVEMDARPIFDFLNGVCSGCGELADLLPEDREWIKKARADVTAELGEGSVAAECMDFVSELGRIAVDKPQLQKAADVVAAIDALGDDELLDILLAELVASPEFGEVTKQALAGDPAAWEQLKSQLHGHKGHPVLSGDIRDLAPAARQVVHAWLPMFREIEDRVAKMLARDVAARSMDEAERDPIGFVERATNGIRLTPERQTRRVVLAASYFGRPYNSLTRIGDTQIICYPIADAAVGPESRTLPPATTVRLYRALGDETRLRILRLLVDQDRYLTELANELELSKPTVSHHLAQLRSAGLVTVTEEGNLTFYSLRRDRVSEAGPELSAFLAQ